MTFQRFIYQLRTLPLTAIPSERDGYNSLIGRTVEVIVEQGNNGFPWITKATIYGVIRGITGETVGYRVCTNFGATAVSIIPTARMEGGTP